MYIIPVALFFLGIIIGSFLNVLGLRWNSGITIGGRSFCVVCRKNLPWWELVPVVSYVGLNGKCSGCKSKISWQYPLIEFWTGLIFSTLYVARPFFPSIYGLILYMLSVTVFSIFVTITIYDARHKIIPDQLVYSATVVAFMYRIFSTGFSLDLIAGPLLFTFFALIWLVSKGRAMGFGDAKLALAIGFLLGLPMGLSAVVLAFWIGSITTLSWMALSHLRYSLFKKGNGLTMKSEIPFAPYLIVGAWISFIYHLDLFYVLAFTK